MSVEACAALVQKADPLRFRVAMAAPVDTRRFLFPLYAFNVEIARAPWVTEEPMIAEMRLQWWRDALEEIGQGGTVRRHEVVDALVAILDADAVACLDGLIAARRWDIYRDPFEDTDHFESYIDATSGNLMWTAARLLGPADEEVVRDFAFAVGIANLFQAVPALKMQGRKPLIEDHANHIRILATEAGVRMVKAASRRRRVGKAAGAALVAGYHARPILKQVIADPTRVAEDRLTPNPARDALRFANVSLRGWWK